MCADCKADLARVEDDLEQMTTERDQLTVMLRAAVNVMTLEQFAEMRRQIGEHDAGGDSTV
jgi:hypothetical protein